MPGDSNSGRSRCGGEDSATAFPWSLKLDVCRLTADEESATVKRPGGVLITIAWGPIIDGFQAGIGYRSIDATTSAPAMIGETVTLQLFVRNAGSEERTLARQQETKRIYLTVGKKRGRGPWSGGCPSNSGNQS